MSANLTNGSDNGCLEYPCVAQKGGLVIHTHIFAWVLISEHFYMRLMHLHLAFACVFLIQITYKSHNNHTRCKWESECKNKEPIKPKSSAKAEL